MSSLRVGSSLMRLHQVGLEEVSGLDRRLRLERLGAQLFHRPQRLDLEGLRHLLGQRNGAGKGGDNHDSTEHGRNTI